MSDTVEKLTDVLLRNGFIRCDIAACNCGSWHHRYGYPERMREFQEALSEAGHPLCNANGNLAGNALAQLVAERDALQSENARLREALADVLPYAEASIGPSWRANPPADSVITKARAALQEPPK